MHEVFNEQKLKTYPMSHEVFLMECPIGLQYVLLRCIFLLLTLSRAVVTSGIFLLMSTAFSILSYFCFSIIEFLVFIYLVHLLNFQLLFTLFILQGNRNLTGITHIIIDEVHERSLLVS